MKIVKKICNALSMIFLIALLLIAAALIVPKLLGYDQFAVLSGSMEPNIHVGAIAFDKEADPESLKVDDVITYQLSDGTLVTHRIIVIDEEAKTVTTQGDANEAEDALPVAFENIVGKYEFNIPYLGYISIYAKTPLGIGVICGVLVVMILLNFLPDALSDDKDSTDSKKDSEKDEKTSEKIDEKSDEK